MNNRQPLQLVHAGMPALYWHEKVTMLCLQWHARGTGANHCINLNQRSWPWQRYRTIDMFSATYGFYHSFYARIIVFLLSWENSSFFIVPSFICVKIAYLEPIFVLSVVLVVLFFFGLIFSMFCFSKYFFKSLSILKRIFVIYHIFYFSYYCHICKCNS